jgi:hypothetical protein
MVRGGGGGGGVEEEEDKEEEEEGEEAHESFGLPSKKSGVFEFRRRREIPWEESLQFRKNY